MPVIYKIRNLVNNKIYIGSSKDFEKRKIKHLNELKFQRHHSVHLQASWNKHGAQNFEFIILEYCQVDKLVEREQVYLDWFKPQYNICKIAQSVLGVKRTQSTKDKISKGNKGKIRSQETKYQISKTKTGVKLSDEAKKNMSIAQIGRKHSEETKKKMSEYHKGKPKSEEHKRKNGLSKRIVDKWPHEKGSRCRCRECLDKRNLYYRLKRNEQNAN